MSKGIKLLCYFLLSLILTACTNSHQLHSPEINETLDLFFIENQNEELLKKTSSFLSQPKTNEDRSLIQLIRMGVFCESGKTDSATFIYNSLDTASIRKNKRLNFWLNTFNGLRLFRINKNEEAYSSLSKVIDENYDERAKALALRLLARIHFNSGDSNTATEYIAQSTDLFDKAGLYKSEAINHKILGRYYANKKEYAKADEQFEIAKAGLEKANDSIELFYIHINLIDMKIFQGKFGEAKELARRNAIYITDKTDKQAFALLYNNIGEIEFLLHNYDSCRYYYQKTLALPLGYITDSLRCGNACIGISKAFMSENNKSQALKYALEALEISEQSDLSELQYNANLNLAELYKKSGDYNNAYYFQCRATPYLEKLGKKSVENSETVYQSTINLIELESQANKIKAEKRIYIILIVVGISFTIFLLIYGVSTYRLLRSRNEILHSLVKKNLQLIGDERKMNEMLQIQLNAKRPTRKSTDEEKDFSLYNELNNWLLLEKQYMRKDLTVDMVARELGTNRDYLSRAISSQNIHFNELINKFRVEEAVKIFSDGNDIRNKYNLNIIASVVGFKSNSVFIEAFRKQTGMNPAQFRASIIDEKPDKQ